MMHLRSREGALKVTCSSSRCSCVQGTIRARKGLDLHLTTRKPFLTPPATPEESFLNWWRIALTDTPSLRHLAPALHVRRLVLDWSGLTDEAVVLLSLSTSLTDLSLSSNQITDAGARALSTFPALVRLDLHAQSSTSGLTDVSAEALSRNASLTALDLSENKLTPASVSFFTSNTALTTLKLYRSVFPFFSQPPSTSLEQQVARNKADVLLRRKILLQFLFTVARQKRKGEGPFARVPVDIIVHTMRFFQYKEFGKSPLQLQSISHFIFSKVDWMNRHLETKRSMRILERSSSASLPDNAPSKLQLISLYLDG